MASFADATAVKQISSHIYETNFFDDWCIGSVPHGGVVTSTFLRLASLHFDTTLSHLSQPHTITLHATFIRRTSVGPATLRVSDVKLGSRTSTIHASLSQDGREEVVAYITQSNLSTEEGVSFKTGWELDPLPPLSPSSPGRGDESAWERLKVHGAVGEWVEPQHIPLLRFRKATQKVRFFFPRAGQALPSLVDEWICFKSGEKLTDASVGFVSDMFPQIIESLLAASALELPNDGPFWFPTLLLNLEIKKALPPEGVEFLFVRVRSKQVQNGRMDLEVVVMDQEGDLVALSHHVSLIVPAARNTAARGEGQAKM